MVDAFDSRGEHPHRIRSDNRNGKGVFAGLLAIEAGVGYSAPMIMRRMIVIVLVAALPLIAGKKKGAPLVRLPEQTIEIAEIHLATPGQKCANYAWAVALEAILRMQQVTLDQHFWVQKASGGELCIETVPDAEMLAATINGTYTLEDGRKVRLETHAIAGAPMPDEAIVPLQRQQPAILFWRSRTFLVRGVTYDEYIYPNGQRMFQILQLKLLDPLGGKDSELSFVNGRDDPGEIGGVLSVTVVPIEPMPWKR